MQLKTFLVLQKKPRGLWIGLRGILYSAYVFLVIIVRNNESGVVPRPIFCCLICSRSFMKTPKLIPEIFFGLISVFSKSSKGILNFKMHHRVAFRYWFVYCVIILLISMCSSSSFAERLVAFACIEGIFFSGRYISTRFHIQPQFS